MLVFDHYARKIQAWWRDWLARNKPQYVNYDASGAAINMQSRRRQGDSLRLEPARLPHAQTQERIGQYATEQAMLAAREAERAAMLVAAARSQLPSRSR